MIALADLNNYLNAYLYFDKKLNVAKIDPYMTNGMMVQGKEEVNKIGFGVSASLAFFEKAKQENCDAIIVHHSFNYPPHNRYDLIFQNRIGYLIKNQISLFGFHFLLDAHPQIGNNVEILKTTGAKPTKQYLHRGSPWGWYGEFENPAVFDDIKKVFDKYLSKREVTYAFGPEKIRKVVAVSGKGASVPADMQELIDEKVDLFITGEVHEWNRELCKEAGINFIAGGHYASEKFGIQALMKKIKEHFPEVETSWIELVNEI